MNSDRVRSHRFQSPNERVHGIGVELRFVLQRLLAAKNEEIFALIDHSTGNEQRIDTFGVVERVAQAAAGQQIERECACAKMQIEIDQTRTLTELMSQEKVYLESDLTMPKLAELMHCSVNHLSQAVNSGFGMSFFDFLNSYRIEEAKKMLSQENPQSKAILDVSFAVGFNSNSAFYAAFKKSTQQTPAQFRRSFLTASPND